jgi:hypothetical protein
MGHQITISGNKAVEVFSVGVNATLGLANLIVANGYSAFGGGGIWNGGTVCATNCSFTGNSVMENNASRGGAILNAGNLNLQNCRFDGNAASVPPPGTGKSSGQGGAIFNSGSLLIDNCQFIQNRAYGSSGGGVWRSDGEPGQWCAGGAVFNASILAINQSSFISNSATGGNGSDGAPGNYKGGNGGDASGGAIYNDTSGTLLLRNSTVAVNTTTGGRGGASWPGQIDGYGGSAYGAIYGANLVNVTVAFNNASGGGGGSGGGSAVGGIYSGSLINCTVASNSASIWPSSPIGGGTMCSLANTLLAGNSPANSGTITDAGHNLSSDASCAFTGIGSVTNTDPKLGPLADNGGPTLTMALLPGSPAIDAGSAIGAPATDQRGVPRPQGAGVDIGAFEYQYSPAFTSATIQSGTNCQMQLVGVTSNLTLTLQVSTNLLNWWDATNFMAGSNGMFQCVDPNPGGAPARFYRLKSGTP